MTAPTQAPSKEQLLEALDPGIGNLRCYNTQAPVTLRLSVGALLQVREIVTRAGHEPRAVSIIAICVAYESGFGHGAVADNLANPYAENTIEHEAYHYGYESGITSTKRAASAQPPGVMWRDHGQSPPADADHAAGVAFAWSFLNCWVIEVCAPGDTKVLMYSHAPDFWALSSPIAPCSTATKEGNTP